MKSNLIDLGFTPTDADMEQIKVVVEALRIYHERNERYKDNWVRMGWRGQLIRVRERAERLWDHLWDYEPDPRYDDSGHPFIDIDDALDLINFAGFLVRAVRAGNRDGSWW